MDVTSNDLICNGGINPYHQPVSTAIITVPAGAQVTAEWHRSLSGVTPDDDGFDPISVSHEGPILAYLYVAPTLVFWLQYSRICNHPSAKVQNATQSTVTGLEWFKIYQDGLSGGPWPGRGQWAVDKLIANKGNVSFTIPSCIAPGQYLLRVELIGK